jgi:hypothetical protein
MKISMCRSALWLAFVAAIATTASAQSKPNQTLGYGVGEVLTFTYTQNFDCVDQPNSDLNFNGIPAALDPREMQIPICRVSTQPTINPPGQTGNPANTTEPLFVLVPMFSTDNDQNLADAISCSKVVPGTSAVLLEAFKAKPAVYTQCPEPGAAPGTCTMHASRLDLAPVLSQPNIVPGPPTANIFVPTPNHSHVVIRPDINIGAIWWQVIPVLVLKQSDWANKDASSGLTSYQDILVAIKDGRAVQAPSNFFLFFSSHANSGMSAQMNMQ